MPRLKLRNELNGKVRVLEGNAGVYSTKHTLPAHQCYHLDLDPNATYREYVLIVLPDDTRLEPFSSEDVLDYKEIVIKNDNSKVTWVGVHHGGLKAKDAPQKPTNPPTGTSESNPCAETPTSDRTSKAPTGTAAAEPSSGLVGKIKALFGYK